MIAKPLKVVTHEEFFATEKRFYRERDEREKTLSEEEQVASYDAKYDRLLQSLSAIGSVAEGGEDGQFSMYRYVPPGGVITVVSDTETVYSTGAIDAVLRAILASPDPFMVTFDTGSYIGVLPDGTVLGYSEWEDLLRYQEIKS